MNILPNDTGLPILTIVLVLFGTILNALPSDADAWITLWIHIVQGLSYTGATIVASIAIHDRFKKKKSGKGK